MQPFPRLGKKVWLSNEIDMKYVLIFLVPILMLLDYYLTIAGAYLYKKYHHTKHAHAYELNPPFKYSVGTLKFFDLHHFISAAVITSVLVMLNAKNLVSQAILECILGALTIPLAAANGRHIANILTFLRAKKYSHELNGPSHITEAFSIKISQYHILFLLLPLLVICIAQPTSFVLGGIIATSILIMYHQIWISYEK